MDLYHNNISVCAQKVRLALAEKQIRPTEHLMLLYNGDVHTPEYLALNPKGVVPTLVDNGQVIVESSIICEYLDDAYPETPLRPADPVLGARMPEWTQLPDAVVHNACSGVSIGIAWRHRLIASGGGQLSNRPTQIGGTSNEQFRELVELGLDSPHLVSSFKVFDATIEKMAKTLRHSPWLAGSDYSLADIAMLPYVYRLNQLSLSWLWSGDRSPVGDWFARSRARPNFSAINDYLDLAYEALADEKGREATPKLKELVGRT